MQCKLGEDEQYHLILPVCFHQLCLPKFQAGDVRSNSREGGVMRLLIVCPLPLDLPHLKCGKPLQLHILRQNSCHEVNMY